jgi:enediyne biosynthesis protein E4
MRTAHKAAGEPGKKSIQREYCYDQTLRMAPPDWRALFSRAGACHRGEHRGEAHPILNKSFTRPSGPPCRAFFQLAVMVVFGLLAGWFLPRASGETWVEAEHYRFKSLTFSHGSKPGFSRLAGESTGLTFTNVLSADRQLTNHIYLNGSGVAAGDFDGDGWTDLYFCQIDGPNALYRNLGNWTFENVALAAGVAGANLDSTGAAFADLNSNGRLDLIVNTINQGTHLFWNQGDGTFRPGPVLNLNRAGMSLALADVTGNGALDIYIANYRSTTIRDQPNTRFRINQVAGKMVVLEVNGRPVSEPDLVGRFTMDAAGKILEHGEPDALYLNDGRGGFKLVSFTAGNFLDQTGVALAHPPYDWGLSVMFRDLTGNGLPDLYVANDFESVDRIWLNLGEGRFQAAPPLVLRSSSFFSMGVDAADINQNGHQDIFVVDMLSRSHAMRHYQVAGLEPVQTPVGMIENRPQYARNTLFLNRGDFTFAEVARLSGVEASEWSWSTLFLDVDLDGHPDLLITTGHEYDMMHMDVSIKAEEFKARRRMSVREQLNLRKMFPRLEVPNVAFRNLGNLQFEDASAEWGFDTSGISHGMALADLDNDGDLDVVVNNLNGAAGIYRNESGAPRVAVRLKGLPPNTQGIGAKIRLYHGAVEMQMQEVISGGRYLSGDDPLRVFAAGKAENAMRLEIDWRGGKKSVIEGVKANHLYEIEEAGAVAGSDGSAVPASPAAPRAGSAPPIFEDVSHLLKHQHVEEFFDDFARQPLLPRKLSRLGPGIGWHDLDGDGWEELIISSGRGGTLGVFRNDGEGGFERWEGPHLRVSGRDQTGVIGLGGTLLAGLSNYEDGNNRGGHIGIYDMAGERSGESILGIEFSTGPLAFGDMSGDGKMELFIGGRVVAGRYPEAAGSLLMRNEGGRFDLVKKWENLGLVSGAVMSDLTGNGRLELVLALEWGPIRVFGMEDNEIQELTEELGLDRYQGWWNGVATGDINGNGRLDIVAGNWGWNSRYRASEEHPWRVYYGDLNGNGVMDVVEGYYNGQMGFEVPDRGYRVVGQALPFVRERVKSFEEYGRAGLQEIYGEALQKAKVLEVTTLSSMVFFNRDGKFEALELPVEAQLAPVYGVCIGDMDGDGHEDIFLSQNFFGVHGEESRLDAGRGLWLRGDGRGGLETVPGQRSGVKVYGEGRGAALGDYDGDGRVDLAVGQNGAETKLYRNVGGRSGLRVRLAGGANNPAGIGASIRLLGGGRKGAVREVQAGSGYWSQNSAVQVMNLPGETAAEQVWVRWPGGKETVSEIPSEAREIVVSEEGQIRRTR